jgi:DNA-binding PadR family transcriptional regulator
MRTPSSAGFDLWEAVDGLRETFTPRMGGNMRSGNMRSGSMRSGQMGRMGRGDIRTAILVALAEEPMNGYQIIQAIEVSTKGAWKPSPGSVYPTLQLLADEGLVSSEQVGERKVYSLTEAGKEAAAESSGGPTPEEPRRSWNSERNTALPRAGAKLAQAAVQVAQSGSADQNERAVAAVDEARRKLYAILAED